MIRQFRGKYRFLSNFFPAPITYLGFDCATTEHAFQLAKARSWERQWATARAETPGAAKRVGRGTTLRCDWEEVKNSVMFEITWLKFMAHPDLALELLATGDEELQEGNEWGDQYWGVDLKTGMGQNMLGKTLMRVRSKLRDLLRDAQRGENNGQ